MQPQTRAPLAKSGRTVIASITRQSAILPPSESEPDTQAEDWLVLQDGGRRLLAFQPVRELPPATWPEGPVPQQLRARAQHHQRSPPQQGD